MRYRMLGCVACAALMMVPLAVGASAPAKAKVKSAWPAETLTGKIIMVDPSQHLLVVQDGGGIPYDLTVTAATHIRSGSQSLKLSDLNDDVNQQVSLKYVPERRGDVARSVTVQASTSPRE